MLERAATVKELAAAVGKAKSTVAYHVGVLHDAGLIKVVRTRQVRAIEERFYGRTARVFYISGVLSAEQVGDVADLNDIAVAARESLPAQQDDDLRAILRHARISPAACAGVLEAGAGLGSGIQSATTAGRADLRIRSGAVPDRIPEIGYPGGRRRAARRALNDSGDQDETGGPAGLPGRSKGDGQEAEGPQFPSTVQRTCIHSA